ncbi:MAG TPA: peptidoglycan editing factor PgeF [Thermoanaerobaculia bacterium]|nr:peptidoglycan editing factor PgeF [Thermoanaerobaculia bacterium]
MPEWIESTAGNIAAFEPAVLPAGLTVAFSSRGVAPEGEASPTAFLARRFADAIGLPKIPIVRATQVHGNTAAVIRDPPGAGEVRDAGACDILATTLPGVALVVQTADCVPIVLAGRRVIAVVHAGWRGSAKEAAASGVEALVSLGENPAEVDAWMGPSIRACCYEVGGEVAAQFAGDFVRADCGGKFRLDLMSVNRAQLESSGIASDRIAIHPACTLCGGEKFASFRRDGAKSGRMIALVARSKVLRSKV